ncbi:MAG: RrF2 family transcriptional regulator, partial [Oceanidesulfovibrio sp.]
NGGNILTRKPEDISIGAVARILEGEEDSVQDCIGDIASCKRAAVCLRRSIWDDAHRAMYRMLDSYTLADLIKDARLCPALDRERERSPIS